MTHSHSDVIFIKILAERENGFIYHQKIPDVLPELGEMKATHSKQTNLEAVDNPRS